MTEMLRRETLLRMRRRLCESKRTPEPLEQPVTS
jgi:hypothetical protein